MRDRPRLTRFLRSRGSCGLAARFGVLGVLAMPGVGLAQSRTPPGSQTANPSPASEARAAFELGVTALDEGRYRDAVEALEHSRQLRDIPIVNYNLGLAYRALGRNLDAIATFERYLVRPDPHGTPQEIQSVRTVVADLHGSLATIEVHVVPADATVLLDGRPMVLTRDVATVDPGAHVIEADADGFTLERREVALPRGGRLNVTLSLQPSGGPAHLIVVPSAGAAVTTVDGARQPTAIVDLALPQGDHVVTIRAAGYEPFERHVSLGVNGVVRVEARLALVSRGSWVLPVAISAGAAVVVGGVIAGLVYSLQPRQGDLHELPLNGVRIFE